MCEGDSIFFTWFGKAYSNFLVYLIIAGVSLGIMLLQVLFTTVLLSEKDLTKFFSQQVKKVQNIELPRVAADLLRDDHKAPVV